MALPHIKNSTAGVNKFDPVHKSMFEVTFTLPEAIRDEYAKDELILTEHVLSVDGLAALYMAPSVVASSLKTAIFTAKIMEKLGYNPVPKFDEKRSDIVQTIIFNDKEKLIRYVQGIQKGSAIDSDSVPEPWDMPGYTDQVIMASGSFTQGSSIELSCDAPIRSPYIAFQQGALTYEYGKLGVIRAIKNL